MMNREHVKKSRIWLLYPIGIAIMISALDFVLLYVGSGSVRGVAALLAGIGAVTATLGVTPGMSPLASFWKKEDGEEFQSLTTNIMANMGFVSFLILTLGIDLIFVRTEAPALFTIAFLLVGIGGIVFSIIRVRQDLKNGVYR